MRAPPQAFFDAYYNKLRVVVNGYVKTAITRLKTIAAILPYTTPHYAGKTFKTFFGW